VAATIAVSPVNAAATKQLARWEMNEGPSASVMQDSSGRGNHGVIGDDVVSGLSAGGATFYRFPTYRDPATVPLNPERVVQVNDSDLNPGTRDYAITVKFRTTKPDGNMIQKGQSGQSFVKIEAHNGLVSCLFRGASGSKSVNSGVALNNGQWHTIRCERTVDKVELTIDGTRVRRGYGPTGNISNSLPMTIGGKVKCNQTTTGCDYFDGDIDRVVIETS
jgi:hypothetical protein